MCPIFLFMSDSDKNNNLSQYSIGTLRLPEKEWAGSYRPNRIVTKDDVLAVLRQALHHGANDIHINIGHPVIIESNNRMYKITKRQLDATEFDQIADVLRDKTSASMILAQDGQYDGQFVFTDMAGSRRRLRVNMTATTSVRLSKAASMVLRPMEEKPPMPSDIGLPEELVKKMFPAKGAVYVIGPTGSGKTTTFASLFRYAAQMGGMYHGHLACYESPPEFDLEGLSSEHLLITQVGIHQTWGLQNFADGVRNALRRHPSAMMIGEVRDYETVQAVIEAALTGHPVFGTVHADTPSIAFQRLLSRFPVQQQNSGLYDLIQTTEVILAQRLINRKDGGRCAVREWIVFDNAMRQKLLAIGTNTGALIEEINRMVEAHGCTFARSAQQLYEQGVIAEEELQKILER